MPTRPLRPVHRFAALCAVLLVTACSIGSGTGDSAGHAGRSSSSGPTARSGTLNAAISAEPDQLDPQRATTYASFEVLENVFDTLVEPDEQLRMQPALAESWTFKLASAYRFDAVADVVRLDPARSPGTRSAPDRSTSSPTSAAPRSPCAATICTGVAGRRSARSSSVSSRIRAPH